MLRFPAKRFRPNRKTLTQAPRLVNALDKCLTEAAVSFSNVSCTPEKMGDVVAAPCAVDETTKPTSQDTLRHANPSSRPGSQHVENPSYACTDGFDVPERKRGRDQSHDFLVTWIGVPMNELDRIGSKDALSVRRRHQGIQP